MAPPIGPQLCRVILLWAASCSLASCYSPSPNDPLPQLVENFDRIDYYWDETAQAIAAKGDAALSDLFRHLASGSERRKLGLLCALERFRGLDKHHLHTLESMFLARQESPSVRLKLLRVLHGKMLARGDDLRLLRKAAQDDAQEVRVFALSTLVSSGDKSSETRSLLSNILAAAVAPSQETVFRSTVEALIALGGGCVAIPYLTKKLQSPSLATFSAECLVRIGVFSDEVVLALCSIPEQSPDDLFEACIEGFAKCKVEAAFPFILRSTRHESRSVRRKALWAIGRFGLYSDAIGSCLSACLRDPDDLVVADAILAIGSLGSQARESVPVLVRCLKHPSSCVRDQATTALAKMGLTQQEATERDRARLEYCVSSRPSSYGYKGRSSPATGKVVFDEGRFFLQLGKRQSFHINEVVSIRLETQRARTSAERVIWGERWPGESWEYYSEIDFSDTDNHWCRIFWKADEVEEAKAFVNYVSRVSTGVLAEIARRKDLEQTAEGRREEKEPRPERPGSHDSDFCVSFVETPDCTISYVQLANGLLPRISWRTVGGRKPYRYWWDLENSPPDSPIWQGLGDQGYSFETLKERYETALNTKAILDTCRWFKNQSAHRDLLGLHFRFTVTAKDGDDRKQTCQFEFQVLFR
jgi:hypothetical protein